MLVGSRDSGFWVVGFVGSVAYGCSIQPLGFAGFED